MVTASLAWWLRRPPREWQTRIRFPLAPWGFFSWSSHASDLRIGTPMATLPVAWRSRVSAGPVGPVSICFYWVR